MKNATIWYEIRYRLRGYKELETYREDDIREAYRMLGSIKHLTTHTEIIKHVEYTPSFQLL